MAQCIVVGSEANARHAAHMLTETNVSSRGLIINGSNHKKIIEDCCKEGGLKVVAVFCNDFPDNGLAFVRDLRINLLPGVRVHALKKGTAQAEPTTQALKEINVDEVFCHGTLHPFDAAKSIKGKWFPKKEEAASLGARIAKSSAAVEASRPVVPPTATLRKEARKQGKKDKKKQVLGTVVPVPASSVQLKETVPEKKTPLASALETPPFELLLKTIQRNSVLPLEPKVISIVGKHGQTLELDPRRIKPMPDNPRWATNEGFSPESLRELGEGIKLIGQLEDALVCPIIGDPDFDAQMLDAERRLRACKLVGLMIKVNVREDITPEMRAAMWVVSVVRNNGKVRHTTREMIHIVSRLRSDEFGCTIGQVATMIGEVPNTIIRLSSLGKLHPQVQAMLDDTPDEVDSTGKKKKRKTRKLTSYVALLLTKFPVEEQLAKAEEIISQGLSFKQAKRFVLGEYRKAGIPLAKVREGMKKRLFDPLMTLTEDSIESFGIYVDMPDEEIALMLANCSDIERQRIVKNLKFLSGCLNDVSRKIEKA